MSEEEVVRRVRLLYGDREAIELEKMIKEEYNIYWFK